MTIGEIKEALANVDISRGEELEQFIETYGADERGGAVRLVEQARKRLAELHKEKARTEIMYSFERKYAEMGYNYICGIDEVGRGPLAGPVVACAVILPKDEPILYLNDSKQVSAKKREELYDIITERAVAYGIGIVSEGVIDDINILQATYKAMRIALSNMKIKPDLLLNDAVKIPEVDIHQVPIIKGDTLSASIAAASIVAKVTRDRLMKEYDALYPGYDFASNVGYGSAKHIAAIKELGPCDIHRKTFIKNFL